MTHDTTHTGQLDRLATSWKQAKAKEAEAKSYRLELEAMMLDIAETKPDGSATTKTLNFKVTTTGKLTRKVDAAAITAAQSKLEAHVFDKYFTAKWSVSTTALRTLRKGDDEYPIVTATYSEKPAKTAIKVEDIK